MVRRIVNGGGIAALLALLAAGALRAADLPERSGRFSGPSWLPSAVIYCVDPDIFSPAGDLAGVTAQLGRLKALGVSVLWLMPITPRGQATGGHPAFNSPYCVRDYASLDPKYGAGADLKRLVSAAHRLGMRVLLDEVLNHTAWDNPLISQHPEFYVHSDSDPHNPRSIEQAFGFSDVAQFDYRNRELRAYMTRMLRDWVTTYDIDGFRFDTADNPHGENRRIPAVFWQSLRPLLESVKPDLLMLGECEDPTLATAPFELDYGWHLVDSLQHALLGDREGGGGAADVRAAWEKQVAEYPAGALHMTLQDDWDHPRDIARFGSPDGALAAAAFNFTIDGVPLVYNGMEVGNAAEGVNPHTPLSWTASSSRFPAFYSQILRLRNANPALQQGALRWLTSSAPAALLTYERSGAGKDFLVEINLSNAAVTGSVAAPAGAEWIEVTPAGAPGGASHPMPPGVSLQPKDFALFERAAAGKSPLPPP